MYKKKRLLVIAYALSPTLGSEYRSAWELVNHLSREFELTVILGDSDGLMGSFDTFESYAKNNKIDFKAVKVSPKKWQIIIAKFMLSMPLSLMFPVLLKSWHKSAYKVAKSMHDIESFDIAHQLGPIGFRNPGYLWRLNCHTYWGPIGGAQYVDTRMIKNKRSYYYIEAIFRNIATRIQAHSPYIYLAAKGFNRLSFTTIENARYFSEHYGRYGPVISDQGLYDNVSSCADKKKANGDLVVSWAGTLTSRKNVCGLLDVIRGAPSNIKFNIMGTGPLENSIIAAEKEFANLNFKGMQDRAQLMQTFRESDVILITSLSEANTATLFEAIENNCVPIAPRINGFISVLNDDVAILINQGNYQEAVNETIAALVFLSSYDVLRGKVEALQKHKSSLRWSALAESHMAEYV